MLSPSTQIAQTVLNLRGTCIGLRLNRRGSCQYQDALTKLEAWGPFETFGQAKKDAIAYFRTDVDTARMAIKEIRASKKPTK